MDFMTTIFLPCCLAFLISALLTGVTRIYSIKKAILDIPNERSSHCIPTPRGGGIAIVIPLILLLLWLGWKNQLDPHLVWTLLGGGVGIAAVGYCDDVFSVKARQRILVHFIVAAWAVYWLGGPVALDLGFYKINLHGLGNVLALLGIVWCINFYNFMDGIDGLAGSEAVFVGMASGMALGFAGLPHLALFMWLITATVSGFTLWNWPPAKIFLGDVGSGFLGFIFSAIGLYTSNQGLLPISFWWLILAVFICDATFTLLYRIYQGEKWYSAHREHAYQHLISYGATHKQVTLGIFLMNCCVVLPAAFAALYWPEYAFWFVTTSILSFLVLWTCIKSKPIHSI